MAGHSKWANIKHRKGAQDAARAKMFAKFSKEIMVAASQGGGDPNVNASLRLVISKAKAKSMPKANIDKAIQKGIGASKESLNYKEVIYSGTLKKGVVFLVICLTDNFNRLSSEIQHLFRKANGNIGKAGSIPYNFVRKGILEFEVNSSTNIEELMLEILELSSNNLDIANDANFVTVYTDPSEFNKIKESIEKMGYTDFKTAEVNYDCDSLVELTKEETEQMLDTIDRFEDNEDIQEVHHNIDLSILEEE
ncbi:MAG: YebC/PmpR family DNA-binding transcriptional regulator [Metamycoplasmataceae bacterium]